MGQSQGSAFSFSLISNLVTRSRQDAALLAAPGLQQANSGAAVLEAVNGDSPADHDDGGNDEAERNNGDVKERRIFKQGHQEDCCHSAKSSSDNLTS